MKKQFKKPWLSAILYCLLVALALAINPYSASDLQLFQALAKPRKLSEKIIIIAMNEENIPTDYDFVSVNQWPRDLHIRLIRNLQKAKAKQIIFDLFFQKSTQFDNELNAAILSANNVFLVDKIKQNYIKNENKVIGEYQRILESRFKPAAIISAPSVFVADGKGFYYQYPATIDTFKGILGQLPLALVFWELLQSGDLAQYMNILRREQNYHDKVLSANSESANNLFKQFILAIKQQPQIFLSELDNQQNNKPKLRGLIKAILSENPLVLNFPGKQFLTLDYDEIIQGLHADKLTGSTVFVGLDANMKQAQSDGFLTPISGSGQGESGVFLQALSYENIANNLSIYKLDFWSLICLIFGVLLIMLPIIFMKSFWQQNTYGSLVLVLYIVAFAVSINNYQLWLPLLIPLGFMLLIWLVALIYTTLNAIKAKKNLSAILSSHMPEYAVSQLVAGHSKKIAKSSWGVCLVTDARDYTTRAENQLPATVHAYLNKYYQSINRCISQHGGIITSLVGDMMLALWLDKTFNPSLKQKAVKAALALQKEVAKYNMENPEFVLETGIGLHAGEVSIGSLGGSGHYEFRPIGDMINTATRIESMNKTLGANILASNEFIDKLFLANAQAQLLGNFRLKGKNNPVQIYSIENLES